MRRTATALATLICIGALVAPSATPALADALSDAQQKQQQEQNRISNDNQQKQRLDGQIASLDVQLTQVETQIAATERDLAGQKGKLDQILGGIEDTQRRLDAKKAELARRLDLLHRRSRVLYKQDGVTSLLAGVFSANSFAELIDRFLLMRDITHEDQVLAAGLTDDRRQIEATVASLEQQRQAEQAQVDAVNARQNDLNGQYIQREALRHQLGRDRQVVVADAAQAAAALAQVNAEVAALQQARRHAHSSGIFGWPGDDGPITQPFGCTDFRGEPSPPPGYSCPRQEPYFHTGIDIAGPYGTEIDAADGGIAYTYSSSSGYGNHVIVVHANGFTTLYGHMSRFAIVDGQTVAKGQAIGYEGSTGFSSGPHLHFEIRLNDAVQDPCRYVHC